MKRTINILEYLPHYLREYKEVKEIMLTENPEFQLTADLSERVIDNQFIVSADSEGLARYENMLNLYPNTSDLETRRVNILLKWNSDLPYTMRVLKERLEMIFGAEHYQITLDANTYLIKLELTITQSGQQKQLEKLLKLMLPCNIKVEQKVDRIYEATKEAFIATAIVNILDYTIRSDKENRIQINAKSQNYTASTVSFQNTYNITTK